MTIVKTPSLLIRILPLAIAAAFAHQAAAQETSTLSPAQQSEVYYRQGQAAVKAGDPDTARTAYLKALQINPRHAGARFSLGELKIHSGAIASKGREAKFGAVMVPELKLDQATLQESLDALRAIVEKESNEEVAPNFIIQDPKGSLANARITLVLKAMPAKGVLQYLMDQSAAKARFDEHAIVIAPN